MKKPLPLIAIAALAACPIPRAEAVAVTYGDLGSFLTAANGPLGFESFESMQATNLIDAGSFVLPGFTVSHSFSPDPDLGIFDSPLAGLHATDGSNFLAYQSAQNAELILDFLAPINAFSLDLIDWGDYLQTQGALEFFTNGGHSMTIANSPLADGNQLFFGMIDTQASFTQVRLRNSLPGDAFAVDAVRFGTAEPPTPPVGVPDGGATWILLGCGSLCFGLGRRFTVSARRKV